jgi:phytoene synthase
MNLAKSYESCEKIVKQHSSSFYRAFSILPQEKRIAVWAVYAFCRTVDDIVDENPLHAEQQLAEYEQAFTRMLQGLPDEEPHWIALHDVFQRYTMDPLPFWDMIAGQRQDLTVSRMERYEDLTHYCYLVAGTVGLMLLPILTNDVTPHLKEKAIKLGIAMQITNILRDVAEDYRRGRIYLPQDLMRHYGYAEQDIELGMQAPGWKPLFDHLAHIAEQHYQEGISSHVYYPRESRTSLSASGYIYREILVKAIQRHGDVFAERIRVSQGRKTALIVALFFDIDTWRKRKLPIDSERQLSS